MTNTLESPQQQTNSVATVMLLCLLLLGVLTLSLAAILIRLSAIPVNEINNQFISFASIKLREVQSKYLLLLISESAIDRPRRSRVNPRVVKIKMSKFKRKNSTHKSEIRDFKKDL